MACLSGKHLAVRELLKHPGTRIIAADVHGDTGLTLACRFGEVAVIRELLRHPELDLDQVEDAVALAEWRGHPATAALLRGHRAVRRALRARGRASRKGLGAG